MHQVSLDFVRAVEGCESEQTPATGSTDHDAGSGAPEPRKPTKYDELVDILADGLLEMLVSEGPTRTRLRPRERRERTSSEAIDGAGV